MSTPTPEQRAWQVADEFRDYLIHDGSTAAFNALVERVTAAVREAEPAAALLSELAELRTLTHDLLLDRDASVGREIGRGEAMATVEGLRREASRWPQRGPAAVSAIDLVLGRLRALGPVRPLPPPERLAARCRALEDALGACVAQMEAHIPVEGEAIDAALEGARGLLEAERGTVP
jgi:hypothetical protein